VASVGVRGNPLVACSPVGRGLGARVPCAEAVHLLGRVSSVGTNDIMMAIRWLWMLADATVSFLLRANRICSTSFTPSIRSFLYDCE
jgi:hypothetical protein